MPQPESDRVRRALLSVDDPRGLTELASALAGLEAELVATRGTRRRLTEAGLTVRPAEELTGIGEWFGGRIKTLHPGLLGGLLAPPTAASRAELAEHGLLRFDLVAVNFYPYAQHLTDPAGPTDREEFIDIGGVTLARAAAKNHAAVAVLSDPDDYPEAIAELHRSGGRLSAESRRRLAQLAFARTAAYDATISATIAPAVPPPFFPETIVLRRASEQLRYGENPHQAAALYAQLAPSGGFRRWPERLVKGTSLSYTNLLDLDTALGIVAEFPVPTAAVVKHATPCGVASGRTVSEALGRAVATDPVARYGCVIATNRPFEAPDADSLHGIFVDLLAAPGLSPSALERLERRPKLKVVEAAPPDLRAAGYTAHSALGALLVQEADRRELSRGEFRPVTTARATAEEADALEFAWRVVRHAKSNAIVLAQGPATVGIGSGQPTRVKAVELACEVAGDRARGAVLASDALIPFPDGVEAAGRAGVRAILQPGGSLRDAEVIAAAERYGIAMYFTGWRVFRH